MFCRIPTILLCLPLFLLGCDADSDVQPQGNIPSVKTAINVKIKVGEYLYENVDATIKAEGISDTDKIEWSEEFDYIGSEQNIIEIAGGFHHYRISVSKWGVEDSQVITYQQLLKDRADGPTPVTHVFGGEVEPKKLHTTIRSHRQDSEMTPYLKEVFDWEGDRLIRITDYEYNQAAQLFQAARYFDLIYDNNKVTTIKGYHYTTHEQYIQTEYRYQPNGAISQIIEANWQSGNTTTVDLTYNYAADEVTASYTQSNGNGFMYTFKNNLKNLISDKTTKGSTLCSEGTYEYDKNINPFRHLGYMDLFMSYSSVNNKTDENINWVACAFPELIVESFSFDYDADGYPTKMIAHYSNGQKGETLFTYH